MCVQVDMNVITPTPPHPKPTPNDPYYAYSIAGFYMRAWFEGYPLMAKLLKRFWNRTCLPILHLFRGCYRENLQLKPASYPHSVRGFRFQFSLEPSLGM